MGIVTLAGKFNDIPQIHYNNISDNVEYGINNTLTTNLSATNNWWGDPLGPYHPITNINGTGNQVSDNVTFDPWSELDDFTPPIIEITNPLPGIYIMNNRVISRFPYPLTFGPITIKVDASDTISGIYKIEFYKTYHGGRALASTTYDFPYEWLWNEKIYGFYGVEVIVYDNAGYTATATIPDILVVNFGFWIP